MHWPRYSPPAQILHKHLTRSTAPQIPASLPPGALPTPVPLPLLVPSLPLPSPGSSAQSILLQPLQRYGPLHQSFHTSFSPLLSLSSSLPLPSRPLHKPPLLLPWLPTPALC